MKLVLVEAKEVPVRYGTTTYLPGDTFEMEKSHFNERLVNFIEDVKERSIHDMTRNELMSYAKDNGYSVTVTMKKEDILELIEGDSNVGDHKEDTGFEGNNNK